MPNTRSTIYLWLRRIHTRHRRCSGSRTYKRVFRLHPQKCQWSTIARYHHPTFTKQTRSAALRRSRLSRQCDFRDISVPSEIADGRQGLYGLQLSILNNQVLRDRLVIRQLSPSATGTKWECHQPQFSTRYPCRYRNRRGLNGFASR
jgi:hypothetical protein